MIFCIIVVVLISPFFKRINGIACSTTTFLDHVSNGLAPDYSSRAHEWNGLDSLIDKLESIQTQTKDISRDPVFYEINNEEDNYKDVCNTEYNQLKGDANAIQRLLNSSFYGLTNTDAIYDLENVNFDIFDAEDDAVDDLYDSLHDHMNKLGVKLTKAIFIITLIISFLGLAILVTFLFYKNMCLKIIYVIIWNLSMLLVFLAFIFSSVFGIFGYIMKDAVQVFNYIFSSENLNSDDPLIFDREYYYDENGDLLNNNYISDIIETCANGDGNITNAPKGGQELNSYLDEWKRNRDSFIQRRDSINCNNGDKLKNYYTQLIGFLDQSLSMTYNITNETCRFARNDKNILLNEAKSGGKKGVALPGLGLMVGILLGISVFAGIIFVHKYYATWKEDNKEVNNINESNTNIGQENNTTNAMNINDNMNPNPFNNMMPNPNNNEINPK